MVAQAKDHDQPLINRDGHFFQSHQVSPPPPCAAPHHITAGEDLEPIENVEIHFEIDAPVAGGQKGGGKIVVGKPLKVGALQKGNEALKKLLDLPVALLFRRGLEGLRVGIGIEISVGVLELFQPPVILAMQGGTSPRQKRRN